VLKNGDIVEILTSKNAKGPSRDWMKIARSSEARSKIRQWFKKEKKEENIANGRAAFEAELKHCGISMKDVLSPEMLPVLLKRVSYGSLDDMYAAIGYGGFTAQKAVSRIQGELNRVAKLHQAEKAAEELAEAKPAEPAKQPSAPKRVKSEQGIIVEGLDNCLVKFSKCCTPVPGDDIIGFITRGYGVSVHRCDCPNRGRRGAGSRSPGAATPTTAIPRFWRWCARTGRACCWTSPLPSPRRIPLCWASTPAVQRTSLPSSGWRSG